MSERKMNKTSRRINNFLLVLILLTTVGMLVAFGLNIYKIIAKDSETVKPANAEVEKPENEFINDYYTIGHNATEVNKEYFRELNDALDSGDQSLVAQAVTKCFITEYYTWTNKDGNYDVGGMQYVFKDGQRDFEVYSRYNFYHDLDLYISQLGNNNLLQVASVTIDSCEATNERTVEVESETETDSETEGEENSENTSTKTIADYNVTAHWTYEPCSMSTDGVQNSATFKVVNNNGRLEIDEIR